MDEEPMEPVEDMPAPVADQTPRYSVDAAGHYAVWIGQPVPDGFTEVPERPHDAAVWDGGAWV